MRRIFNKFVNSINQPCAIKHRGYLILSGDRTGIIICRQVADNEQGKKGKTPDMANTTELEIVGSMVIGKGI